MLNDYIEYEKMKTYQWREDFFIKKIPRADGTGNFPFCYVCPRRRRGLYIFPMPMTWVIYISALQAYSRSAWAIYVATQSSKPIAHRPQPIAHSSIIAESVPIGRKFRQTIQLAVIAKQYSTQTITIVVREHSKIGIYGRF